MTPFSLLIAVRFHEGRYHGQEDSFNDEGGWPPSPGRLFQALVSGAAQGDQLPADDKWALEWLEELDPPTILAPTVRKGQSVQFYVPNNDLDAKKGDPSKVSKIKDAKRWRPCFFDPHEPVLYLWDFESGAERARRVCAIAARLYQLGRGIDMAWATGEILKHEEVGARLGAHSGVSYRPMGNGKISIPVRGTLDSLVSRYRSKRRRLQTVLGDRKPLQLFVQPPKALFGQAGYDTPQRRLHFELRSSSGTFAACPLRLVALLISGLRDAAANRLCEALPGKSALFERLIIGRNAGPADLVQRIRLIPVPSIGAPYTDLSVRRIMIEVPPDCPIRQDDLKWAFAGLQPCDPNTGELWSGIMESTENSQMASRFNKSANVFRSITPVVLPGAQRRRIGTDDQKAARERSSEEHQAAAAVIQALRHADCQSRPSDILVQREPFQKRGVRAEFFANGSRFTKHALWHVETRFPRLVPGPLVICDGGFCVIGLIEPVFRPTDVFAISLDSKRQISVRDYLLLVRALRRALMSLARDRDGHVGQLFSGHEPDGRPDSRGYHAHVFLAADGCIRRDGSIARLIVAAPWSADRRSKRLQGEQHLFEDAARRIKELRAGRLGVFRDLMAEPVPEGDPLIGPARDWISKTPYVATRNLKKSDDSVRVLSADFVTECIRRGLPKPAEIQVSDVTSGPRGGRPSANLKLRFATAVRGPLLLGRDSHSGGGLFVVLDK